MTDRTHCDHLAHDTKCLLGDRRLNEQLVDKIVLQLYRVYPQILTEKEAQKFRCLDTPLHIRLSQLLQYLQKKGDTACHEFYRALQINAEHIYTSLPSRRRRDTSPTSGFNTETTATENYILNDRGPVFFLACFSAAAGLAFLLYYCSTDAKTMDDAKKVIGFSALGVGMRAKTVLISYVEEKAKKN
ncbi:caspase recruitment domain-containing protein 19 [Protopterus annectens]|uniref:caspase recruitment domain-containing protein 19 n=1 Tax=Protopterus annectens TaxID=7888 RepID=UPI001CF933B5|nr:caspase recruitment domain-containing protein 19 [Protopterus annectens]